MRSGHFGVTRNAWQGLSFSQPVSPGCSLFWLPAGFIGLLIPKQTVLLLVPCAFDSSMSFVIVCFVAANIIVSVFGFSDSAQLLQLVGIYI